MRRRSLGWVGSVIEKGSWTGCTVCVLVLGSITVAPCQTTMFSGVLGA